MSGIKSVFPLNLTRCHGPLHGIKIGEFLSFLENERNFGEREKGSLLSTEFLLQMPFEYFSFYCFRHI